MDNEHDIKLVNIHKGMKEAEKEDLNASADLLIKTSSIARFNGAFVDVLLHNGNTQQGVINILTEFVFSLENSGTIQHFNIKDIKSVKLTGC